MVDLLRDIAFSIGGQVAISLAGIAAFTQVVLNRFCEPKAQHNSKEWKKFEDRLDLTTIENLIYGLERTYAYEEQFSTLISIHEKLVNSDELFDFRTVLLPRSFTPFSFLADDFEKKLDKLIWIVMDNWKQRRDDSYRLDQDDFFYYWLIENWDDISDQIQIDKAQLRERRRLSGSLHWPSIMSSTLHSTIEEEFKSHWDEVCELADQLKRDYLALKKLATRSPSDYLLPTTWGYSWYLLAQVGYL